MRFIWTELLWLAALLPLLVVAYLWLLRRRKRAVIRVSSLALVRRAMVGTPPWRRHLPPLLLWLAAGLLIVAGARPVATVSLPMSERIIMMVMDVSASMKADDVAPNRLTASQVAAKAFVQALPQDVRIGVVAYGGTAQLVQPPTLSREDVLAAIDRFQLQRGTAIGAGMLVGLASLFPELDIDLTQLSGVRRMPRDFQTGRGPGLRHDPVLPEAAPPAQPGSYAHAVMVLLTDGQNTSGPDPMLAAQMAADRGLRVFTVGIGSSEGAILSFEGWSMRVRLDEATLQRIANLTLGRYYRAGTGAELNEVYESLKGRLTVERKETEVTALVAYAAAILLLAGAGLSLWWFGRAV